MKKHRITFFTIVAILLSSFTHLHAEPTADKAKAKVVLMKTNRALGVAHMTVKRTKKYTGKLAKAVRVARFARKQYIAGNYDKSIYLSLYARKLAREIMAENAAKTGTDFALSPDEQTLSASSPSDDELSKETEADDASSIKDEDLMSGGLNIEVQ